MFWLILLTIAVAVITACLMWLVVGCFENKPAVIEPISVNSESSDVTSSEAPKVVETPIDFDKYKNKQKMIIAILSI